MAWIQPNGVVFLYKDVPLLPNYNDTVYFESQEGKDAFFDGYYYKSYANISYQRVGRNKIRLEGSAEDMYSVNYMSFINNDFNETPKMFYAFVDDCEYINNNTFELRYHIDVMTTWATEIVLEKCFVEREHASVDSVGLNLVPEPVDINEHYLQQRVPFNIGQMMAVLCVAPLSSAQANTLQCGVYNPLFYYCDYMTETGCDHLNKALWLLSFADMRDCVISLFMFPENLLDKEIANVGEFGVTTYHVNNKNIKSIRKQISRPTSFKKVTGGSAYVPHNKKLLTYPYIYLAVNTTSKIEEFKFENFSSTPETPMFDAYGFITAAPKVAILPIFYEERPENLGDIVYNINKTVIDENFPELPCYSGSFTQLLGQGGLVKSFGNLIDSLTRAQEKQTEKSLQSERDNESMRTTERETITDKGRKFTTTITRSYGSSSSGGKTVTDTFDDITSLTNKAIPSVLSEISIGSNWSYSKGGGGDVLSLINNYIGGVYKKLRDEYLESYAISGEFAETVDNFFSYYGYATNKIKVPNRHVRKRWTYVKTKLCKVHGNIPASDLAEIASIFDSGITFWDRNYTIGDYQLDDNPTISS